MEDRHYWVKSKKLSSLCRDYSPSIAYIYGTTWYKDGEAKPHDKFKEEYEILAPVTPYKAPDPPPPPADTRPPPAYYNTTYHWLTLGGMQRPVVVEWSDYHHVWFINVKPDNVTPKEMKRRGWSYLAPAHPPSKSEVL